ISRRLTSFWNATSLFMSPLVKSRRAWATRKIWNSGSSMTGFLAHVQQRSCHARTRAGRPDDAARPGSVRKPTPRRASSRGGPASPPWLHRGPLPAVRLPRVEAVVVALAGNLVAAELDEYREPGPHLAADGQASHRDRERSGPLQFDRHGVPVFDCAED